VLFQIPLDGAEPRDAGTWLSPKSFFGQICADIITQNQNKTFYLICASQSMQSWCYGRNIFHVYLSKLSRVFLIYAMVLLAL